MSYIYVDFLASLFCPTDLLIYSCANNHTWLNYRRSVSLVNLVEQRLPSCSFSTSIFTLLDSLQLQIQF